jgi:hypothetical protein
VLTPTRKIALALVLVTVVAGLAWALRLPSDQTPAGAYLRIAKAVRNDEPSAAFAYLEQDAQHACFTVADYASRSKRRILEAYPESEQAEALAKYDGLARDGEGPAIFVKLASDRAWLGRLRRDLSGVKEVAIDGDRATVVTARGTRYSFRRRPNGIWGMTLFTAELSAEAERLARDWDLVQAAAHDYLRASNRP